MRRLLSSRGEVNASTLFWILFLLFVVYEGFQFVPALISQWQFRDEMQSEARFSIRKDIPQIQSALATKARQLRLPISANMFRVTKKMNYCRITVEYEQKVEWLPGREYKWKVREDVESDVY